MASLLISFKLSSVFSIKVLIFYSAIPNPKAEGCPIVKVVTPVYSQIFLKSTIPALSQPLADP